MATSEAPTMPSPPATGPGLAVDAHNPRAAELVRRLSEFVDLEHLSEGLCVVVGGDGFMLRMVRERGPGVVFLGLNAGRLGFLLNDVQAMAEVVDQLRRGAWTVTPFPRLRLTAHREDGACIEALAMNDLYVERATGQTAHLKVFINGDEVVDRLICDGMLVATSLGSTAYTYSAGGVPCHPRVPAVAVTPISPHRPRLTPLVLPLHAVVELEALDLHRRPVRAVADGVDLGPVARIRVEDAQNEVRLAFLESHDFTRALFRKVLRG